MSKSDKMLGVFLCLVILGSIIFLIFIISGYFGDEDYNVDKESFTWKLEDKNRKKNRVQKRENKKENNIKKFNNKKTERDTKINKAKKIKRKKIYENVIYGFVRDKNTKEPIKGARVVVLSDKTRERKETLSDHKGKYKIKNIPIEKLFVYAFANGYDYDEKDLRNISKKSKRKVNLYLFKIPKLSTYQISWEDRKAKGIGKPLYTFEEILKYGIKIIKGRVFKIINKQEVYVKGKHITIDWKNPPYKFPDYDGLGSTHSGINGTFKFKVYPGKYNLNLTEDYDYDDYGKKTVIVKPDDTVVIQDLRLRSDLITVKAKLIDKVSRKVLDANTMDYIALEDGVLKDPLFPDFKGLGHVRKKPIKEFSFYPVVPGKYTLRVIKYDNPKGINYKEIYRTIEISEDKKDFEIELERSFVSLSGRVLNENGDNFDFSNGSVIIKSEEKDKKIELPVSKEGKFYCYDLEPGEYNIYPWYSGFSMHRGSKTFSIIKGMTKPVRVKIYLNKLFFLKGTVSDSETGAPIKNAECILYVLYKQKRINALYSFSTKTDSYGSFKFNSMPESSYLLIVKKKGYAFYEKEIELKNSKDIRVRLSKGFTFKGKVIFKGSKGLVLASANLKKFPTLVKSSTIDSKGNFRISNVKEGEYIISIEGFDIKNHKPNKQFKRIEKIRIKKGDKEKTFEVFRAYTLKIRFLLDFSKEDLKKINKTKKELIRGTYGKIFITQSGSGTLIEQGKVWEGKEDIILPRGTYDLEFNPSLFKSFFERNVTINKDKKLEITLKSDDLK